MSEKPINDTASAGNRRLLTYILLGIFVGVPACCGAGALGLWVVHIMNKPDPIPGKWSGSEPGDVRREAWPNWTAGTEIKLTLQVENGEHTGTYFSRVADSNAPPGKSFPIKWNVDGQTLELEMIGEGTFWTGEKKARFAYTITEKLANYDMKLVPAAPNKSPVTFFKMKPRPFPT